MPWQATLQLNLAAGTLLQVVGHRPGCRRRAAARIHNAACCCADLAGTTIPAASAACLARCSVRPAVRLAQHPRGRRLAQRAGRFRSAASISASCPDAALRAGAAQRQFDCRAASAGRWNCCWCCSDDPRQHGTAAGLPDAAPRCDTALAVLRAPPDAMRLFLGSAMASVSAMRATLRMPARTQDSLREKLARLQQRSRHAGRRGAGGRPSRRRAEACQSLDGLCAAAAIRANVSGNDLLPLAHVSTASHRPSAMPGLEEQRHEPPPAARRTARGAPPQRSWHEASERRWNDFLRRRGEEIGTLARLVMSGAQHVPRSIAGMSTRSCCTCCAMRWTMASRRRSSDWRRQVRRRTITVTFAGEDRHAEDHRARRRPRLRHVAHRQGGREVRPAHRGITGDAMRRSGGTHLQARLHHRRPGGGDGQGRGMTYLRSKSPASMARSRSRPRPVAIRSSRCSCPVGRLRRRLEPPP